MKGKMVLLVPILLTLALVFSGCGGDSVKPPPANAQTVPTTTTQPTSLPPTTTPPTTQPPTQTTQPPASYPEGYVFTSGPTNPKAALEVLATFFFLCDSGKYNEAEKLCTKHFVDVFGPLDQLWKKMSDGKKLASVTLIHYQARDPDRESIQVELFFVNRDFFISAPTLIKESGAWKFYD